VLWVSDDGAPDLGSFGEDDACFVDEVCIDNLYLFMHILTKKRPVVEAVSVGLNPCSVF